ncbi:zinc finger protein 236-like [Pseudomyrmex gracilis]|uniref:zinc finger protein 236-like n=1 Tax=Pseudomyrmex gracilis TaxID=219809 RepID=UPI0009956E33|nr:zinc finger protein 236-like [Pseudomyrmex gracilis]
MREEILAQAQSRETRALRVRRSTKILLSSLSEQVHAERQSAPTSDASSQRRRPCEEEIQQLEGYTYTREKLFGCSSCGRKYTMKCNLRRHMMYECGGKRLFSCKFCRWAFTQKSSLVRHLTKRHNINSLNPNQVNPYPIAECVTKQIADNRHQEKADQVEFASYHRVTQSIIYRTDEILQSLQIAFPTISYFSPHVFSDKTPRVRSLRKSRHAIYVREEDLALKCPQCGRGYKFKSSLFKHLKYECGGRRNFTCHVCNQSFTQNVSLRRHALQYHGVRVPPKIVRKIVKKIA